MATPEARLVLYLAEIALRLIVAPVVGIVAMVLTVSAFESGFDPNVATLLASTVGFSLFVYGLWRLRVLYVHTFRSDDFEWQPTEPARYILGRTGLVLALLGAASGLTTVLVSGDPAWRVVVTAAAFIELLITGSRMTFRMRRVLDEFLPGGPRHPLLRNRFGLRLRILLATIWTRLVIAIAGGMWMTVFTTTAFLGRLKRLRVEAYPVACPDADCNNVFENPPLVCRYCPADADDGPSATSISTWPRLEAPVFVVCPNCQSVHSTWQTTRRAIHNGGVSLVAPTCWGCDGRDPSQHPILRIMLLCLGTAELPNVYTELVARLGPGNLDQRTQRFLQTLKDLQHRGLRMQTPATPITQRIDAPCAGYSLRLRIAGVGNQLVWAGDQDAVIVLPVRTDSDEETLSSQFEFALSRLQLPFTSQHLEEDVETPSLYRQLFGVPRSTSGFRRVLATKLAVWSPEHVQCSAHRGLPVTRLNADSNCKSFYEGLENERTQK